MIAAIQNPFDIPGYSYRGPYARLENAVAFLNVKLVAGPGTEFVLTVDDSSNRPVVQMVDIESRRILQELPNATIFALVNKYSLGQEIVAA